MSGADIRINSRAVDALQWKNSVLAISDLLTPDHYVGFQNRPLYTHTVTLTHHALNAMGVLFMTQERYEM